MKGRKKTGSTGGCSEEKKYMDELAVVCNVPSGGCLFTPFQLQADVWNHHRVQKLQYEKRNYGKPVDRFCELSASFFFLLVSDHSEKYADTEPSFTGSWIPDPDHSGTGPE